MKQNNTHPAVEAAKNKMIKRYIAFAVCLVVCIALLVVGFFVKPKSGPQKAAAYGSKTPVDTFVKSDITVVSALFSQDVYDGNGNVTGENYHILAVDTDGNKFILTAPKEYYESVLKPLEDNTVMDVESGNLEILDKDSSIEVFGYTRDMSHNLTEQLGIYFKGYEDVLLKYSLELDENPEEVVGINIFYVISGTVGIIAICILISDISRTAEYKRVKKKHEKTDKAD